MTNSSLKGQKTLWEKEKLLVTSNFSFSHSVFKRLTQQTKSCKNQGLFGKGLNNTQEFQYAKHIFKIRLNYVQQRPKKFQSNLRSTGVEALYCNGTCASDLAKWVLYDTAIGARIFWESLSDL